MPDYKNLLFAASFIALNLILGKIAATFSLPLYLDTIGTIVASSLLPWRFAVIVGVGTSLLAGIVIHPVYPLYFFNQFVIASLVYFAVKKGLFKNPFYSGFFGLFLGLCATIVAAPVTVLVFGGITLSGVTGLNAVFMAAGSNIWEAVIKGALIIESLDKVTACLIAYYILKQLPSTKSMRSEI